MKVSVALATYNGAEYLPDQLDSFLRQSRRPDELVVSDDASTDQTVAILEAFAQSAPFAVHVERKSVNAGYIRNFDTALSLCDGDVIFMSDQDDVWFPEKMAVALEALEQHPEKLLFVNDAELVSEDLTPLGLTTFAQVRARGESERAFTQGSCFALRRELLAWVLPLPDALPIARHLDLRHRQRPRRRADRPASPAGVPEAFGERVAHDHAGARGGRAGRAGHAVRRRRAAWRRATRHRRAARTGRGGRPRVGFARSWPQRAKTTGPSWRTGRQEPPNASNGCARCRTQRCRATRGWATRGRATRAGSGRWRPSAI